MVRDSDEIREKLAVNDFSKLAESIEAAKQVERFLKESSKPTMTFETDLLNAIDGEFDNLMVENGLLFCTRKGQRSYDPEVVKRLVIPAKLRSQVLALCHDGVKKRCSSRREEDLVQNCGKILLAIGAQRHYKLGSVVSELCSTKGVSCFKSTNRSDK